MKRWFRDLTELIIETNDFKFNSFIEKRTGQKFDLFKRFFDRVEKIIQKGKITNDTQFYEINALVNELSQTQQFDIGKIEKLNRLLLNYEQQKLNRSTKKR